MKTHSKQSQAGLAIITVMLIVALMVTLLAFLVEKQHLLTRRITNQTVSEQGYQYAMGVEQWAARVLHDDKERQMDSWVEDWAVFGDPPKSESEEEGGFSLTPSVARDREPLPSIDFGIDGLSYKIEDLQSRYNLNNLANENPAFRKEQRQIFVNLLELLGIGEYDQRQQLTSALIDWLDKNDTKQPDGYGFESGDYQVKRTPYYASDQKLSTIGELRFVEGFDKEVINELSPFVTVLPIDSARININTASAEVLSALGAPPVLGTGSVESFLAQRQDPSFLGFQANQIQLAGNAIIGNSITAGGFIKNMMQTTSQFFLITTRVVLGDFRYCSYTSVLRENAESVSSSSPKVTVLNRSYNTLCDEIIR